MSVKKYLKYLEEGVDYVWDTSDSKEVKELYKAVKIFIANNSYKEGKELDSSLIEESIKNYKELSNKDNNTILDLSKEKVLCFTNFSKVKEMSPTLEDFIGVQSEDKLSPWSEEITELSYNKGLTYPFCYKDLILIQKAYLKNNTYIKELTFLILK